MPTAGIVTQTKANQLYLDGWLGQYSLGVSTTLVNAQVTGEIFQFRWVDATRVAAITKLQVVIAPSASQTTLDILQLDLIKATGWSGQGTGVVSVDMTAGTNKRRTSMPTSLVQAGDIRYSGTPLGAGTKSLEANSLASVLVIGVTGPQLPPTRMIEYRQGDGDYPLVLATNEGFVLKIIQNTVAGNGVQVAITVDWIETAQS